MQLYIFLSVLSSISLMMTLYDRNTLLYKLPQIIFFIGAIPLFSSKYMYITV